MCKIGILGAGTWGIALARLLAIHDHQVTVWSAIETEIDALQQTNRHKNLPFVELPHCIAYTKQLDVACKDMDVIVFATPSPYIRKTAESAKPYIQQGQILVNVAKGIESNTLLTMSEIIAQVIGDNANAIVALSGPTHAEEVARDLPTTIVASGHDMAAVEYISNLFSNEVMRVYSNADTKGVELCGAVKNVISLAAGISTGLGYGDNAKAAIITRGMAEITRLGLAMGCAPQTFNGLTGIGDLIVTATSKHSRNNQCGQLIGQGLSLEAAIKQVGMVVEGVHALPAVKALAKKYNVEMPIVFAIDAVLNDKVDAKQMVLELMTRQRVSECSKNQSQLQFENILLSNNRRMGMKRVITYGTFDLLHYGHINLLKRAKALGDYLIVVVSSDEFNWNEKRKKCYFTYEQRKALVEAVRYVDLVIPEESWEQKRTDVRDYHIDTFVMGDDWKGKFDYLKEEGVEVVYLPRTPEVSTTQIKHDLHNK